MIQFRKIILYYYQGMINRSTSFETFDLAITANIDTIGLSH